MSWISLDLNPSEKDLVRRLSFVSDAEVDGLAWRTGGRSSVQ